MVTEMRRREVERALSANGCTVLRDRGNHTVYGCPCGQHIGEVPRHRIITAGVVRSLRNQSGLSTEGMAAMKTYQVRVYRDPESPRWWLVEAPELRVLTQARRIADAAGMARDLIAIHLDVPLEDVAVEVTVDVGSGLAEELAKAAGLRESAAAAEREASAIRAGVAQRLAADGLAVRDIGAVLGVSFQRAHQLLGEHLVEVAR